MDNTVDREIGVTAAQVYLRDKGNAIWLKRQHSLEAHKNALLITGGFIAGLIVGAAVLVYTVVTMNCG